MSDRFIGRYRLLQRLGVGGWAEVWSALDEQTGDRVALKRLHPGVARDEAARARLRREAAAVRALDHPGIVGVLDVIETGEEAALVLQFIDGEPLSEVITREGRLQPDRAIRIVGQVAGALAAAHAAGIVHRDVKPANVLLDRAGDAHLTDFGIARSADAATVTATGDVLGTLRFMAPETLRGEPPTPAADVWALGALAYVLLEGKPPHPGAVPAELLAAREGPPPTPRHGGAALGRLVASALHANPAERPADAGAFSSSLEAAVAGRRRGGSVPAASAASAEITAAMPAVVPHRGAPETAAVAAPIAAARMDDPQPASRAAPGARRPLKVPAPLVAAVVAVIVIGIVAAGSPPDPAGVGDAGARTPAPTVSVTPAPTEPTDEEDDGGKDNGKGNDKKDKPGRGGDG